MQVIFKFYINYIPKYKSKRESICVYVCGVCVCVYLCMCMCVYAYNKKKSMCNRVILLYYKIYFKN